MKMELKSMIGLNKEKRMPVKAKGKRSPGRPKQTALFKKTITLELYGTDKDEIQQVAAHVRKSASSHDLSTGTRTKRKVSVCHGKSHEIKKVFDGVVG